VHQRRGWPMGGPMYTCVCVCVCVQVYVCVCTMKLHKSWRRGMSAPQAWVAHGWTYVHVCVCVCLCASVRVCMHDEVA